MSFTTIACGCENVRGERSSEQVSIDGLPESKCHFYVQRSLQHSIRLFHDGQIDSRNNSYWYKIHPDPAFSSFSVMMMNSA
jgi:hypothetical protein